MRTHGSKPPLNQPPARGLATEAPDGITSLFRRSDWLTLFITFAAVWCGYFLTLAPEVTLEDSGELATGSFYAGIPHSPGYPVWTLYTWLWTVLLPWKNIAWRVALAEATSGALAAGLVGLLVSRGASLMIEGVSELKILAERPRTAISVVCGFVAGLLTGFNGLIWSQSVIVEVYSFAVCSFMIVLVCLLRWMHSPAQRRFLYAALFGFGICFTNHQTLIVAAMGIEVAIAATDSRLGRQLFLGNSIVYLAGFMLSRQHAFALLEANPAVLSVFHAVGLGSIVAFLWLSKLNHTTGLERARDGLYAASWLSIASLPSLGWLAVILGLVASAGFLALGRRTLPSNRQWLVVLCCGGCWLAGVSFYLYLPLAGLTNPPMEWGYPRTVDGFIHAFTRGQYEKTNPTDVLHHPLVFFLQLLTLVHGLVDEFSWVCLLLALIPFLFFFSMRPRERAWLLGLASIYLCLGVLLLILLNPPPDLGSQQIVRVFFAASHAIIALLVGYGLALVAAAMASQYPRFRPFGLIGGSLAVILALFSLAQLIRDSFFGENARPAPGELLAFIGRAFSHRDQYALPIFAGLFLVCLALAFLSAVFLSRKRAPLATTLAVFALIPLFSILTHWSDNEQRNHWFGYWVGHDAFKPPFNSADGKPLYPEMSRDAILFAGTDAGRFCPTYMIFDDSFIRASCRPRQDPSFDRRDVYLVSQDALADPPYLNSVRAQYNRSQQLDPPFFQELGRFLFRDPPSQTNSLARAAQPLDHWLTHSGARVEQRRRTSTSWFKPEDFLDLQAFAGHLRPTIDQDPVSRFLYDTLSIPTKKLLDARDQDTALRRALARDLNTLLSDDALAQPALPAIYDPDRFRHVDLPPRLVDFLNQGPPRHSRIRLNRLLLEAAYPTELARSPGGVYPDLEIYVPSPDDLQRCYADYRLDVQRRIQLNQLEPAENVSFLPNGTMQLSGPVAIMAINGMLARLVFDHNTNHDFFLAESTPIKWMYPYLTPYGIIMRINRDPPAELGAEAVDRDHQFWNHYTTRLIGNWIDYDTPLQAIVDWVNTIYRRRDFTGFSGDRKFVRDDQAQKVFSKLRCAQAGIYSYRLGVARTDAERRRMLTEADFAFRQAFALCPFNHENVLRYAQLLVNHRRFDDAILIAHACLRFDPHNAEVIGLLQNLETWKKQDADRTSPTHLIENLEKLVRSDPTNLQAAFDLAANCLQQRQTNRAVAVLDSVLARPDANAGALYVLVQAYSQIREWPKVQNALERLVKLQPGSPEAWWNLAAFQAFAGRPVDALSLLKHALELNSARLQNDPSAHNLAADLSTDPRFSSLSANPEFQKLLPPKP